MTDKLSAEKPDPWALMNDKDEVRQNEAMLRGMKDAKRINAAGGLASAKTLRDEFAMAALANCRTQLNGPAATPDDIATVAYGLADAMIDARKEYET